jgi:membrane-anchored mycosin MYCP
MRRLAAVVLIAVVIPAGPAQAAPPPGTCTRSDPARPVVADEPWPQRTLDYKRVRPWSTGAGVTVAVVDSGVDADHPQLAAAGTVLRGEDFHLIGDFPGNFDCGSHGTSVASIIAAAPAGGVGFAGLAPGARILPVRIAERELADNGAALALDPAVLARGIWYAAEQGAKVINLSFAGAGDNASVRDALAHARAKDALVVAAVGNGGPDAAGLPSYPAGYDGVLGVGAVDQAGVLTAGSQVGAFVDLVAPGAGVLVAARAGGHRYVDGTSFAAAYVSATAALVRAAWPHLSAEQAAARILATATPAPGGRGSTAYGAGLVSPFRAVTDGLVSTPSRAPEPVALPPVDPAAARTAAWWNLTGRAARAALLSAGVLAVLIGCCAWVVGQGRRNRWRARRTAVAPVSVAEVPDDLFAVPPPPAER